MTVYPLRFKPIFQPRLWGGRRLETVFHKPLPADMSIGESWELSDMPGNESVIANGQLEGLTLRQFLNGHAEAYGFTDEQAREPFGLFIKFLDAKKVLSVQVHPDEEASAKLPGAALKTECWYVLDAEPDAAIYYGLHPGVSASDMEAALTNGTVDTLLQVYQVKRGDFFFVPAGTVHALGAGVMVAEIQTPSDTTYRLFDWNRVGDDGKPRPLHIEQAMESIHFTTKSPISLSDVDCRIEKQLMSAANALGKARHLASCPYFHAAQVSLQPGKVSLELPFPAILIALDTSGTIKPTCSSDAEVCCDFSGGDTVLLPHQSVTVSPERAGEILITCLGSQKA